jgi:hypothetical protein
MSTLTGSKGAFYQPATWGRNEAGNYSLWTYHGTKDEVYAAAAAYANVVGLIYEVKESFGMHRLDVRFPWNMQGIDPRTDIVENWELFANTVEADILSTQIPSGVMKGMTAEQIAKIRFYLSDPPDPSDPVNYPTQAKFVLDSGGDGLEAYTVWLRMKKGVLNFPVEAPVLRHTITTSNQYAIGASFINVRRLITTASLYSVELAPANYLFNLPIDPAPDDPLLHYGWRKLFPTVQQIALLKWQIVQEYHYGLWDLTFWQAPI